MSLLLLNDEEVERPKEDIPDAPAKPSWSVALKRAASKFSSDQCTDKAAALTYYSMQSLFPGLIAVLSLINVFGNGKETTDSLVKILAGIAGKDPNDKSLSTIRDFIDNISTQGGGGVALVVGILLSIWSASGYVGGFSRALNKIYEIPEGRPVWKLRPALYLVTIIEVILIIVVMIALTTTGSVATSIANEIGIPSNLVTIWDIAKWPFVVLIVVFIIGMLYWATPNVRKTKRDIFTWGALIGFVVWVVASGALVTYFGLTQGASYQKTYGVFAGAIMFMLWLWITNIAMLFGAEVDAELIRTRQLKSGLPAEEMILLPPKDDSGFAKQDLKAATTLDVAHDLRLSSMKDASGDPTSYGRASLAAGHAALVSGAASTAGRGTKTGIVGPRDAGAPRGTGSTLTGSNDRKAGTTVTPYDPQLPPAVEEARLLRRDAALIKAQRSRKERDRLERQQAKAKAAAKQQEKKEAQAHKIAESHITREERWASVERVRAQYAPPEKPERDQVAAERAARRAAYDANLAERQAKAAAEPPKPPEPKKPKVKKPPMPSELRTETEQEQQRRRDEWFATHPPRSTD
ncbi:YihY/virulence factor BrkB family protein [Flexivirga sp. ID2601S]|uniref:YihY/virulence factor BrkB family protein n=1 Tax=Flexivirga aerilata TaxID=1656889 RepID=A0A849AEZ1_9MICO|nr:YihY/virulence factor BrkB family protein [Flexivirga aerilata]NNG39424.1 YihY/virulence factor BrkB family protein [Flexivirga aerilata]